MPGNNDNLSSLWNEITPKLYGYLVNTLRDRNLAQDVLQTAWLKALENLSRFDPRGRAFEASFSSWIFAIARNECREHWRRGGREVPLDLDLHDRAEASPKEENKIFLDQILGQVPENDRELLRLRYIADLSLGDIAGILKISPIAARVRMHRALAALREKIENQYEK